MERLSRYPDRVTAEPNQQRFVRGHMRTTALALLCGFVFGGAQAIAQEAKSVPVAKPTPPAAYVVGVTGMT